MIGINAEYQRSDELWLALSLTKTLERFGHDVQVMPAGKTHRVHPYLDQRLTRARNYSEWAGRCSWIVYTELPPRQYVSAAREAGAKTALMIQWAFLDQEDLPMLAEFDALLCPARSVHRHFSEQIPGGSVVYMPFDLNMPIISKEQIVDPERIAILWYLDGSQPLLQELSFMDVVRAIMKDRRVYMTVMYSNRLAQQALAELLKLQLEADGRLELMRDLPWERQFIIAADHDLFLWPSVIENTGVAGQMAATAGTPCLAYDYPLIADFVKDEVNGILVPCDLKFNELQVPTVVRKDDFFVDNVHRLMDASDLIQHMRQTAHSGIEQRREEFFESVSATFDPAAK